MGELVKILVSIWEVVSSLFGNKKAIVLALIFVPAIIIYVISSQKAYQPEFNPYATYDPQERYEDINSSQDEWKTEKKVHKDLVPHDILKKVEAFAKTHKLYIKCFYHELEIINGRITPTFEIILYSVHDGIFYEVDFAERQVMGMFYHYVFDEIEEEVTMHELLEAYPRIASRINKDVQANNWQIMKIEVSTRNVPLNANLWPVLEKPEIVIELKVYISDEINDFEYIVTEDNSLAKV